MESGWQGTLLHSDGQEADGGVDRCDKWHVEGWVPHAVFQTRIIAPRIVLFQYAVSADGKRFLINSLPASGTAPITVLVN
jgi:hypothetical protein